MCVFAGALTMGCFEYTPLGSGRKRPTDEVTRDGKSPLRPQKKTEEHGTRQGDHNNLCRRRNLSVIQCCSVAVCSVAVCSVAAVLWPLFCGRCSWPLFCGRCSVARI